MVSKQIVQMDVMTPVSSFTLMRAEILWRIRLAKIGNVDFFISGTKITFTPKVKNTQATNNGATNSNLKNRFAVLSDEEQDVSEIEPKKVFQ